MLKQRLITAAILIPLVIWGILALPTAYLAIVLALLIAQGGWEWAGFMQLKSVLGMAAYIAVVVVCIIGAWWLFGRSGTDWLMIPVLSLFWWLTAIVWVLTYPATVSRWAALWRQGLIGLLVLVPAWLAVVALHGIGNNGPYLLLYLLSLIWVADSGAYFGGRRWGKRKLAPEVSPGKTWEGAISASLATMIYALVASYLFHLPGNQILVFVVLSMITVVFSIFGDLTESMFKRHAGIKDSGHLLPGHGGVLDRIDSITAAAPVFVLGLWLGGFQFSGMSAS